MKKVKTDLRRYDLSVWERDLTRDLPPISDLKIGPIKEICFSATDFRFQIGPMLSKKPKRQSKF